MNNELERIPEVLMPAQLLTQNPQTVTPRYLTPSQAAKMLSVSVETIMRRIKSGSLPAKHLRGASGGGRGTILVNQVDVLALLEDY